MNPTIQRLILQITLLALQVNSQGKWHVFTTLSGHVRTISVRVLKADTDYDGPQPSVLFETVRFQAGLHADPAEAPAIEQSAIVVLAALLSALDPFLDATQIGSEDIVRAGSSEVLQ